MSLTPEMIAAFEQADLCYLATCSADAQPNVVPVGFKWMYGDRLLLADLFLGKTRANIEQNGHVAVSVATAMPKVGYQFKGKGRLEDGGGAYQALCRHFVDAGSDVVPRAALVVEVLEAYQLDAGEQAGKRLF